MSNTEGFIALILMILGFWISRKLTIQYLAKKNRSSFIKQLSGLIAGFFTVFIIVPLFMVLLFDNVQSEPSENAKPPEIIEQKPEPTQPADLLEEPIKVEKTKPLKATLGYTVDQFTARYNQSIGALGLNNHFSFMSQSDDGETIIGTVISDSKNIGLSVFASSETKELESVIYIGTGDGSTQSGIAVSFGAVAVVMAIENPQMVPEKRKEILISLGLLNGEIFEKDNISIVRNGIKYTAMFSESTGLWLTVESN